MRIIAAIIVFSLASLSAHAGDLLIFTRSGCGACDRAKAAIASDPAIAAGHTLTSIDTQSQPLLARMYRVKAVPVFVLEINGKEVARTVGFSTGADLKAWLEAQK